MKEIGIHVNAEPRDGHDPHRILEDGDGNDAQGKAGLLPDAAQEKVLRQQAGNEQGQPCMDAAALFRDLNLDSGQRKLETVSDDRYSHDPEQGLTRCGGPPLQNRYGVCREGNRERAHEEQEQ